MEGRWTLQQLKRQVAYDRLLDRLYLFDDGWIVKGAMALLVGADLHMTGHPEDVLPLARGVIPAVEQRGYRAYPLVDHVADKVVAIYELHGRDRRPSTRYRDLVDLVAIVAGASVPGNAQTTAIRSEFDRRGVVLPDHFDVPDRVLWEAGYAAEARRSLLRLALTLDEALAVVRPFLDPVLYGTAVGSWDKESRAWVVPAVPEARGDGDPATHRQTAID